MTGQLGGPQGPRDPGNPDERGGPPSADQVRDEISREILRIHEESYGSGAGKAKTFVGEDFVVVVLDGLELLPPERLLIEGGLGDMVIQVRARYQQAIRDTFSAAVERATGRRVVGFASSTSVEEHRFAAEIFRLE